MILHVIEIGQWIYSEKKIFKGGDRKPALPHNHISLLSSRKENFKKEKDVTVASIIT